jgi:hypothetical protein
LRIEFAENIAFIGIATKLPTPKIDTFLSGYFDTLVVGTAGDELICTKAGGDVTSLPRTTIRIGRTSRFSTFTQTKFKPCWANESPLAGTGHGLSNDRFVAVTRSRNQNYKC